jgi:hypothetical protein
MRDPEKSDSGIVVAKPTKKPGDRAKSSEQGRPRAEMQAEPSWVAASVPRTILPRWQPKRARR